MPFKSKKQERYLQINEPEIYQDWVEKYGHFKGAESLSLNPMEVPNTISRYYMVFVDNKNIGSYLTVEEAQEVAESKNGEVIEYIADLTDAEREYMMKVNREFSQRQKTGEFFKDWWWKEEADRFSNGDDPYLRYTTTFPEENDFFDENILGEDDGRSKWISDAYGISPQMARILDSSRVFGMYMSQRDSPATIKKYRERILDAIDDYTPQSEKEAQMLKVLRPHMATRGVKGPSPSFWTNYRGWSYPKPVLNYYFDDYYDYPVPFMGYDLDKDYLVEDYGAEENEWELPENLNGCDLCGKSMLKRIKNKDGQVFYYCTNKEPTSFREDGCMYNVGGEIRSEGMWLIEDGKSKGYWYNGVVGNTNNPDYAYMNSPCPNCDNWHIVSDSCRNCLHCLKCCDCFQCDGCGNIFSEYEDNQSYAWCECENKLCDNCGKYDEITDKVYGKCCEDPLKYLSITGYYPKVGRSRRYRVYTGDRWNPIYYGEVSMTGDARGKWNFYWSDGDYGIEGYVRKNKSYYTLSPLYINGHFMANEGPTFQSRTQWDCVLEAIKYAYDFQPRVEDQKKKWWQFWKAESFGGKEWENCPTCKYPLSETAELEMCGVCGTTVCKDPMSSGCGIIAEDAPFYSDRFNKYWDWLCSECADAREDEMRRRRTPEGEWFDEYLEYTRPDEPKYHYPRQSTLDNIMNRISLSWSKIRGEDNEAESFSADERKYQAVDVPLGMVCVLCENDKPATHRIVENGMPFFLCEKHWFNYTMGAPNIDVDFSAESFRSYKVAPDLSSYTKAELVSSIAGPQGTAAYDEVVYDPLAQSRLSAESIDSFSPARLIILGASIGVALGLYNTRGE